MSQKLNYEDLVQKALIGVVKDLLRSVGASGLPGRHHFYITYNTTHPDVVMPDYLRDQYPESITIVIQSDFWDLEVMEEHFEITLSFNNLHEHLVVPFDAMTSFVDPSAKFGLQFTPSSEAEAPKKPDLKTFTKDNAKGKKDPKKSSKFEIPKDAIQGNIISFDAFKKKN